ncbi:MAG: CopG family transcriptional regulator [Actinomycetota bacterium]|nr:CopG family transcriptional regulator [Actinomycetota bacterium]
METRNVTVTLQRDLLRRVKIVAAKRDTSISALLTGAVEDIVRQDDLEVTRRRIVERLSDGYDLGSDGRVPCGRDDLHDR